MASPLNQVRHQMFLGDVNFTSQFHETASGDILREVCRSVAKPLAAYRTTYAERNQSMARASLSGAYTMQEIGEFFGSII